MAIGKKNTAFLNQIIELWKGLDGEERRMASINIMGDEKQFDFYSAMSKVCE